MLGVQIRHRVFAAAAGLCLIGSTLVVSADVAQAEPDIADVKAKVDSLYAKADQATENYNESRLRLAALNREIKSLKADQKRQQAALDGVKEQLRESMLHRFEGSNLSAVGQVVLSEDPKGFLGQLTTMSSFDTLQEGIYTDFTRQAEALELRREATAQRAAEVRKTESALEAEKKSVEAKLAEAKTLLNRLEEEERREVLSRSDVRMPDEIPAEGRVAAVIAYATAQLGDAYVWGAVGPNAFDCSGLTMQAWAAAGVSLPHSSRAQYNSGPKVARADLQVGDLVFYYTPISHVGIYIGGGKMLHAARPGEGVKISGVDSMPYVGAVRPG